MKDLFKNKRRCIILKRVINAFDKVNEIAGLLTGIISLFIMCIVMYEVLSRYVFNAPTIWAMEINQYLFCAMSLIAGGYCLLKDGHVRVDILYPKFSPRILAITEFCTYPLTLLFCGLLVWYGWQETWDSIVGHRLSESVLALPLWPGWLIVPLAGLLMGIQTISRLLRRIWDIKTASEENAVSD